MAYTKTVTDAVGVAGACTVTLSDVDNLYVGDSVTIVGVGQHFNGTHTLTAVDTDDLTIGFTADNVTATYSDIAGQLTVNVKWVTESDVETWLGFEASGNFLDDCTAAANEWAFRKRLEAGYTDRTAYTPNPAAKEGTILYGAYLYRDRGSSGDTYAAFDGMGQFERPISMARVMQLLGIGKPQVG